MTSRRRKASRAGVVAAWTLVWFGTILAINPRQPVSQVGVVVWGAGLLVQLFIVARWFRGRPASGAPIREPRPTRVHAGV
jgi:hypothetical protein